MARKKQTDAILARISPAAQLALNIRVGESWRGGIGGGLEAALWVIEDKPFDTTDATKGFDAPNAEAVKKVRVALERERAKARLEEARWWEKRTRGYGRWFDTGTVNGPFDDEQKRLTFLAGEASVKEKA